MLLKPAEIILPPLILVQLMLRDYLMPQDINGKLKRAMTTALAVLGTLTTPLRLILPLILPLPLDLSPMARAIPRMILRRP